MATSHGILPEHYYQTQVRDTSGALIFNGFVCAVSMADAFKHAAGKWPGCSIRIEGKETRPAHTEGRRQP